MIGKRVLSGAMAAAAALTPAPAAHAMPPNCTQQPWGFMGSQQRAICDGPIQADGSWMRRRVIGVPAHYEYPHTSCYGST